MISLSLKNDEAQMCLDIDCSVTLADRKFLVLHGSHYTIRRMTTLLNVRGLDINKHETSKYVIVIIYFLRKSREKKSVREVIRREIHLMNDLKANMLIDNDILEPEEIFIDEVNSKATIFSCDDMIISIEIRTLSKDIINKILHARSITIISAYSMISISIHNINLFFDRNFLFEPENVNVSLFAHAIDNFTRSIIAKNEFNYLIKIARNDRLDTITEIQYSNAFHADQNIQDYAERKSARAHKSSWFNRILKAAITVYTAIAIIISFSQNKILSNDVIIHNSTTEAVTVFSNLINQYSDL
jgi:hypothetical protein